MKTKITPIFFNGKLAGLAQGDQKDEADLLMLHLSSLGSKWDSSLPYEAALSQLQFTIGKLEKCVITSYDSSATKDGVLLLNGACFLSATQPDPQTENPST